MPRFLAAGMKDKLSDYNIFGANTQPQLHIINYLKWISTFMEQPSDAPFNVVYPRTTDSLVYYTTHAKVR